MGIHSTHLSHGHDAPLLYRKGRETPTKGAHLPLDKGSLFHLFLSEIVCVQGGWLACRYGAIAYVPSSSPLGSTIRPNGRRAPAPHGRAGAGKSPTPSLLDLTLFLCRTSSLKFLICIGNISMIDSNMFLIFKGANYL